MKHNIKLITLYYEGDNTGNSIQLSSSVAGVNKIYNWTLYPGHVISPNAEILEIEAGGSDTKAASFTVTTSNPNSPVASNQSDSFSFTTAEGVKNISFPVTTESEPAYSGTIHLTFLYWKGEPKPRDFYTEFSAMSRCICSIGLLTEQMSQDQLDAYNNKLNGSYLSDLFDAANALAEHLGYGEGRIYYPTLTPCENTGALSVLIRFITENQSRVTNSTLKTDFDTAFDDYKSELEDLKSSLNISGLNPCGDESNPSWEGLGILGEDFAPTASCICKIFAQYASLSTPEKNMADLLETALSDYFLTLQTFLLSQGITYNLSESYPCTTANDITRMLGIISSNFNTWDVLPGEYEELKAPLRQIQSIFAELTYSLPTICSGASSPGFKNPVLQSSYIYLQACGSDNTDDVAGILEGIHLRWGLLKELGENHLPKGDLANSTGPYYTDIAYSKEDDYVKIYKTPYVNPVIIEIDFSLDVPQNVNTNNGRIWEIFKSTTTSSGSFSNTVVIRFLDETLYDSIIHDPISKTLHFIQAYAGGVLEIEVENKLMFAGEFEIQNDSSTAILNYEVIRQPDSENPDDLQITSRLTYTGTPITRRQVGENIRYFRIQYQDGYPSLIKLETYNDFILSRASWDLVGDFGLTLTDDDAYDRLDYDTPSAIDNQWPRFNDGITTKLQNYQDKWSDTNGIKTGVTQYLDLSISDTKAEAVLNSLDNGDASKISISYLESLNLAALDYHIARMLGLGHIDIFDNQGQKYVYIAVYRTAPEMLTEYPFQQANLRDHIYMSLPTDKQDYRIPIQPKISQVTYGFDKMDPEVEKGVLNEDGYGKFDPVRYVNIYRDKYDYEIPFEGFFESFEASITFDVSEIPTAVMHGVEYKETSESTYRIPEIISDAEYTDYGPSGNVSETIPAPDSGLKVYTHAETESGVHKYAVYGINLFARSSGTSAETTTDETVFNEFLSLKPPHNVNAHYIQKEENLLFTTVAEQSELDQREIANPGGDNSFTRVTFEWNHTQKIAYQTANALEFYFRPLLPQIVQGEIENITSLNEGEFINVYTKSFQVATSSPSETVSPAILSADFPKFIGSLFSAEKERFVVVDITTGTNGPVFKVKPITEPSKIGDPDNKSLFKSSPKKLIPKVGQRFQVVENLANEVNWSLLNKTITLVNHSNHSETETVAGKTVTNYIGGIFDTAEIVADPSAEPINGLYKVTFDSTTLADHPQKDTEQVTWYKGTARITNGTEKKDLQVWAIESQNPLIIWVYDPDFENNPITTGIGIDVNFHPGYKVYIDNEPLNGFDRTTLLPAQGIVKKDSLIALRSIDTTLTPEAKSGISIPAGLVGINKRSPVKPQAPVGPAFATRPDTFGKSSYTLDVDIVDGDPFSLAFYRASDFEILSAIYEPEVVVQIYDAIEDLETNQYQHERFNDLVNVIFDDDTNHLGEFKEYDGYRLPNTFKTDILNGATAVEDIQEAVRATINFIFTPVTPEPIVYAFTKQVGGIIQTLNILPVVRNEKGQRLSATDLPFNPYPFAVKFTENSVDKLRFTDYTLDGAAKSTYFYFVREISREMVIGERSDIAGPIRLVNAMPADAPYLRKIETVLADPYSSINPRVRFYINPYHPDENIKKVAIYRTTDIEAAASVSLMQLASEIDITDYAEGVVDDFSDLDFPLFGETIYYRLVALREITNELDQTEYIPSLPSNIVEGRVVDNINPEAPELTFIVNNFTSPPAQIANIELSWEPTTYNGKYYLYKMTSSGNWQKVYEVASNQTMNYTVSSLDTVDEDGDTIYHRYKVDAENANGLLNLDEKPVVISGPAWPTGNLKMMFWDASPSFYPSSGNIVTDLSGNGNDATLSGFASPGSTTSGYYNNSLYFDGLNDQMPFANTWLLNKTEFSFYTVFKVGGVPNANGQYNLGIIGPDGGGSSLQLVRLYGIGTYYTPTVYLNGSIANVSVDGNSANITQKILTDLSKFYHVAFTVKAGEIKLYVDGELIHISNVSIGYLNSPLKRIGWYGSVQQWKGQIPVVMGYDRVISEQEVAQIYEYFKDTY